jgi:hypothetical protein
MMNIKVNKMVAANLAEQLRERYSVIYDQIDVMSESPVFNEQYIKIDKLKITADIDALITVLKEIKKIRGA